MYWQQKGDYLGVKVDRYTKSKKVSRNNKHTVYSVDLLFQAHFVLFNGDFCDC